MKQSAAAARPAKKPASARDRRRMEELRRAREEAYETALKKLSPLLLSVLLVGILVLALSFCDLAYIHNTDVGREVSVSLWSFARPRSERQPLVLCPGNGHGQLFLPRRTVRRHRRPLLLLCRDGHHPHGHPLPSDHPRGTCAHRTLRDPVRKAQVRSSSPRALCGTGVTVILLIGCLIAALSLNGSQILPIYCSGNPACSIRSDGWFPLLSGVAALTLSVIATIRYRAARRLLESPARPVRAGGAA